jgi:DNA-binding response OmpR family regulator
MLAADISVLLIEDNPDHAALLVKLLSASEMPRFTIAQAGTLADGIQRLTQGGIDLVMLDITLPDSQGVNTFRQVSAAAPEVPVVVLSGIMDVALAIEVVQYGAQDYLVKGHVDNHLLLRSAQYALERKRAQVALQRARDELESHVAERTAALREANNRLHAEISDRKRAEQQTLESNQQLAAALEALQSAQGERLRRERFRALGQMAGGIAHEFNNVLTPIFGYAEHLLQHEEALGDREIVRATLEKIRAAAQSGARAVARVRDFARAESGVLGPVDVRDLIEGAVAITEPMWKDEALAAGVTIAVATQIETAEQVHGDPAQLRELLTQLLFNAIHAIRRRGMIAVRAAREGDMVAITVEDDGAGMSEATKRNCLSPAAVTAVREGRATGMAIIHGILNRHRGRMEIESDEGWGSKVRVYLPVVPSKEEKEAPSAAPVRPLRVLIADDEPMVRDVIAMYLEEDGHEVTAAADGREALEKFDAAQFDLVLTDRSMPEMNGDELAREVKQRNPSIPVLLLTGYGDLMTSEGEKPEGVDTIISKPFTLESLRQAFRGAMEGK